VVADFSLCDIVVVKWSLYSQLWIENWAGDSTSGNFVVMIAEICSLQFLWKTRIDHICQIANVHVRSEKDNSSEGLKKTSLYRPLLHSLDENRH
jgi:hypothetical protein